jgi:hypothetical protein
VGVLTSNSGDREGYAGVRCNLGDTPPLWDDLFDGLDVGYVRHDRYVVERHPVDALLLRQPPERVLVALDLETTQASVDDGDIDTDVTLAQPELLYDPRVGVLPMSSQKLVAKNVADVAVAHGDRIHIRARRVGSQT